MASNKELHELRLIENGRGGEFAFLDELTKKYKSVKNRPLRIMRFYRYHDDYIGYKDIGYLSFNTINGNLELQVPVNEKSSVVLVILRNTLSSLHVEYKTTYIPEKYKSQGR